MEVDKIIDVRGKVCPIPLITLAKEVPSLPRSSLVRVVGDDPIFEESILDFCAEGGHEVLSCSRDGRVISIVFKT